MTDGSHKSPRAPFECQRCSDCCTGEGGIYFEDADIAKASSLLGMSADRFIATYLRREGARYAAVCGRDGRCSLLGPKGCLIHPVKPKICRRWPFFPALLQDPGAFEEAKLACPGLDPQATHEQFVAFAREHGPKEDLEP
jgi:Fe-S-cluster containining protein